MRQKDIRAGEHYAVRIRPYGIQKAIVSAIMSGFILVSVPALPVHHNVRQVRAREVQCEWSKFRQEPKPGGEDELAEV